eukprot:s57_g72.t1
MTDATGYIPATAQETLLQTYLGERLAAQAAMLADQWRQPRPGHPGPMAPTGAPPRDDIPTPARAIHPNGPAQPSQPAPQPPPSPSSSSTSSTTTTTTDAGVSTTSPTTGPRAPQTSSPQTASNPPTGPRGDTTAPQFQAALASLDNIDAFAILQLKCSTYKSPPSFLRGPFRAALSTSLGFILAAETDQQTTRAWALWSLLPRMLLHRHPGVRTLPKPVWRTRIAKFNNGEWQELIQEVFAHTAATLPPPVSQPDPTNRRARARDLVHMGELSAARQALLSGPLAPGTDATLAELRDPNRRPNEPYPAPSPANHNFQPDEPVQLPRAILVANLQRARKGAAPGASGLTAETLRLILDDEAATDQYIQSSPTLSPRPGANRSQPFPRPGPHGRPAKAKRRH